MSAVEGFPVGTEVGGGRWPYSGAHPDCWAPPWKGVVLAQDDQQAWTNTLAFPERVPTTEEVREHLGDLAVRRLVDDKLRIPVLWDFGSSGKKVYWERAEKLRPYAEDLEAWEEGKREREGIVP